MPIYKCRNLVYYSLITEIDIIKQDHKCEKETP